MTLCPYKWALYLITAWCALYYILESMKWYGEGDKKTKQVEESYEEFTTEWDSEDEEDEVETSTLRQRKSAAAIKSQ